MTEEKKRIMVVDDEEPTRELIGEYLETMGFAVVTACDGLDALEKFSSGEFDCVVSDMMMPRLNGLELLHAIKKRDSRMPFIMITGYISVVTVAEALAQGVNDYLAKPFRMNTLKMKIEQAVSDRRVAP